MPDSQIRVTPQSMLADGLSLGNGSAGLVGILILLAWDDPLALTAACVCVFAAWGFDSLDGLAARGLQRPASVGAILDSLCDVASFGALPAVLLTASAVDGDRSLVLPYAVVSVAYFCCAVVRLCRYTVGAVSDTKSPRMFFEGVPSPVGAMSVSAAMLAARAEPETLRWMPLLFAVACAPLMVSRIPYKDTPRLAAWLVRSIWPLPVLGAIGYVAGAGTAVTVFFAAYLLTGAIGLHAPR
jgi:CDP-diacylglycerol--serine O-phosphatidyltransferase